MRARVLSSEGAFLRLETGLGEIVGLWCETSAAPAVGKFVSVELDIEYVASSNDLILTDIALVKVVGYENQICGNMESVDEDGMGYLRLAPDSLSLLETDGTVSSGDWVRFSVQHDLVRIYGGVVE
jgi:hypothetical protein